MTKKTFTLIVVSICLCIAAQSSSAATIPAGTSLVVSTVDPVSSRDKVGKIFTAKLDHNVVIRGQVLLQTGTKIIGRVESSRASGAHSGPLSLNITEVWLKDRKVKIKTTGPVEQTGTSKTTTQKRADISVGAYVVAPGKKMEFRLAEPINL
jgi:hypothetical protein